MGRQDTPGDVNSRSLSHHKTAVSVSERRAVCSVELGADRVEAQVLVEAGCGNDNGSARGARYGKRVGAPSCGITQPMLKPRCTWSMCELGSKGTATPERCLRPRSRLYRLLPKKAMMRALPCAAHSLAAMMLLTRLRGKRVLALANPGRAGATNGTNETSQQASVCPREHRSCWCNE